jgi:hypothetical protein
MGRLMAGLLLAAACAFGTTGCGMLQDMQYVRAEREAHERPRVSGLTIPSVPPPPSADPALLDTPVGSH